MRHSQFSRSSFWAVIVLLFWSALTVPALAQEKDSKKNGDQSEPASTPGGRPEKKKPEKKTEKEKKPQLQLLGGKVTYSAPRRWTKPQISTRPKLEALQFTIPLPTAGTAAGSTSAIVIAEPNTDKLSLADFSNRNIPRKYPAGTIVVDQTDGDSWRTVVSYVYEANPPYTVLDRFGVAAGLRVHFRIIFPKEEDAKATWPKTLLQESNEFVHNLRINDKNTVTADLSYDGGKWGMRQAKIDKKSTAKESTETAAVKTKNGETKKAEAKEASHKTVSKKKEKPAVTSAPAEEHEL